MDVVCLGEFILDMFGAEVGRGLTEVSAFRPAPGGAPANVAVGVARLGRRSAFIGKVGEDAFGHYLAGVLAGEGVETAGLRFEPAARTTLNFIARPDAHTAEFLFYRHPGADMLLRTGELEPGLIPAARAFHFGSLSLAVEPIRTATLAALDQAGRAGALVSFDVNYRPPLWPGPAEARAAILELIPQAGLLKVNEAELALLTGSPDVAQGSAALLALGPALVVVTLGASGSYFRVSQAGQAVAAFPVETVDASGCGDAFTAALLCRLLAGESWRDNLAPERLRPALYYANAAGALTATRPGVIPALPRAAEVQTFLGRFEQELP